MSIAILQQSAEWAAMGLAHYQPGQNAFTAVPPRGIGSDACTAPKKRGPNPNKSKLEKALISLETPAERRARHLQINTAPNFNVPIATQEQADRTLSIGGRRL